MAARSFSAYGFRPSSRATVERRSLRPIFSCAVFEPIDVPVALALAVQGDCRVARGSVYDTRGLISVYAERARPGTDPKSSK
jgi:hypothetical protein